MKKTMKILFLVFVLSLAVAALAACGHEHEYGDAYSYDGSHHWKAGTCEHEDAEDEAPILEFATHTMGARQVVENPTCGKAGKAVTRCTVCGFEKVEILNATGEHSWEMQGDDYKPYRETTAGSKFIYEHKKCTVCDAKSAPVKAYNAGWDYDETHHFHAPSDPTQDWERIESAEHTFTTRYTHSRGVLYTESTCSVCKYVAKTAVPNGYAVTDTKSAQAALDAATDGALIYFFPGTYDDTPLYFRTLETGTVYALGGDWAGGSGKIYYREFKNITLQADNNVVLTQGFVVESLAYTPGGPNIHKPSRDGYFYGAIKFTNLTFKNMKFSLDRTEADAVLRLENYCEVDGLTFDGCTLSLSGTGEGAPSTSSRLLYAPITPYELKNSDGTTVLNTGLKNITVKNCKVTGVHQVLEIRGAENVTVEGNTFESIADRAILLAGETPYTGTVTVKNNTVTGLGERFLRANAIEGAITVTGNSITDYTGSDHDVIKITGTPTACTVENNTLPEGKEVTVPQAE